VIYSDKESTLYGTIKYTVGKHNYEADAVIRNLSYLESKEIAFGCDVIVVGIEEDGTLVVIVPQKRAMRWIEKATKG